MRLLFGCISILSVCIALQGCGATPRGAGRQYGTLRAIVQGKTSPAPERREGPIEYAGLNGLVQNPIVSHIFTADPSARVFDGRIYVYASHDLDNQDEYLMNDYHVFSSNDLVNWQDHGVALDAADIPWAERLFAPDAAYSAVTHKYYLYFPNGGDSIGVAVSDAPYGPFRDALGKPLIDRSTPGVEDVEWVFDPTCFVDEDGQAYLYFGGGMPGTGENARVIRLNEDMISLAEPAAATIHAPDFFEAAFMHKRGDTYYFSYSTTFAQHPPTIDYLTSVHPMNGFAYAGTVLPNPVQNSNNNNHHSIVAYEGKWYIFYHNRVLSKRDGYTDFQRSITLDRLVYREDGTIVLGRAQQGRVEQLRAVNAFQRLEAELTADQRGVEVGVVENAGGEHDGVALTDIHNGDWTGLSQVDFGAGVSSVTWAIASGASTNSAIHVYVDGCERFSNLPGRRVGRCYFSPTGGWQKWKIVSCNIEAVTGVHDVFLNFVGADNEPLFSLDYFVFQK